MSSVKDTLWELSFETYYDSYFEEFAASRVIERWQLVDVITRVAVALTASGSAVSGWSLWAEPNAKYGWFLLAGTGAVLSIIHTTLEVPSRLKKWGDIKREFAGIRIDVETFRYRMKAEPNFPVEKSRNEYFKYRDRYGEAMRRQDNEVLRTKGLDDRAQAALDEKIKDQIRQPQENEDS